MNSDAESVDCSFRLSPLDGRTRAGRRHFQFAPGERRVLLWSGTETNCAQTRTQKRGKRVSALERIADEFCSGARIPQGLPKPGRGIAAMSKAMPSVRATAIAAAHFPEGCRYATHDRVAGNRRCFMRVGTKSVLFGAHCFFIHPFFVALGWWDLGQFPWDPRLWAAFFL